MGFINNFVQARRNATHSLTVAIPMTKAEKWKLGLTMLGGKIIGLLLVLIAMKMIPGMIATKAYAGDTYTAHETAAINSINTVWTLVAAFLVFGMQPGFVMLEAGFARSKETVNILMECIFDTCLCGLLFWAFGYDYCQSWQRLYRISLVLSCRRPNHTKRRASLLLRTGYSSLLRRYLLNGNIRSNDRPYRFSRRYPVQHRRYRLHLPDHRPLGLGTGWMAGYYGQHRVFPAWPRTAFPGFRGFNSCSYDWGDGVTCRSDGTWPTDWPYVQAGWG